VICDACIGHAKASKDALDEPEDAASNGSSGSRESKSGCPKKGDACAAESEHYRLTPEQNALISGCVSLLTAAVAMVSLRASGAKAFDFDAVSGMAFLGGCFHFTSYLLTLCAFSSASSTVITPLMQLSAVWMLPCSSLAALLGLAPLIRPVHLLSVILIGAGGFLPAAGGSLSHLASWSFWRQRSVRLVSLGELLICCYNMILHQATFAVDRDPEEDATAQTLRFFLVSRASNGLMCVTLFCLVPRLRGHAHAIGRTNVRFLSVALIGELLSICGVCLVTFSYSTFYEPSVVNAVEGGLQQLFNLIFAIVTSQVLGCGRVVDQVTVKVISFVLVAVGLTLSTV
jgi:hypothetical protein